MPPVKKPRRERRPHFLREWRKFRHKNLEEIAATLEIHHSTLSRIERNESPYDQDILERLGLIYGCEPEDLLTINPQHPDKPRLIYNKLKNTSSKMVDTALTILDELLKAG